MGTAALALGVEAYWGASAIGHAAAVAWYFVATVMLAWVIVGFVRHHNPPFVAEHLPAWAMTAMGVLSLSMATSAVLGWWRLHTVYWIFGTVLAFVVTVRYLVYLPSAQYLAANFTWALPLLAPAVAGAPAGTLSQHVTDTGGNGTLSFLVHAIGVVGLLMPLITAVPVLVAVYIGLARQKLKMPLNFTTIYWIPLGVIGQTTAGAQLLGRSVPWEHFAYVSGVVIMVIGTPMLLLLIAHWCWAFFGGVLYVQQRRGRQRQPS